MNNYINKIKELNSNRIYQSSIIIDDSKNLEDIKKVYNEFKKNNIKVSFMIGRIPGSKSKKFFNVSKDIYDFVKKTNTVKKRIKFKEISCPILKDEHMILSFNNFFNGNGARFENFYCKPYIEICPNGDIKNGLCGMDDKIIGNVFDNNFTLENNTVLCNGKVGCQLCATKSIYTENA